MVQFFILGVDQGVEHEIEYYEYQGKLKFYGHWLFFDRPLVCPSISFILTETAEANNLNLHILIGLSEPGKSFGHTQGHGEYISC